ncbi:GNAT family N-acetyltransferase [Myroides marinus]|jgi:GNAT superfamily N-acetyltransferase|uniref:GNAT family N-acetyltransferase n=1 Tax=Myroides marinus TaxID=703342 RepID=UPI002577DB1E|nr:GNAT family N-acetyltransferase [Myroides marinus]MDR0194128.1 GNAT family N-acetyltransferase [Myroides sp.]MDM1347191.1 GNAT family N-acetyltransferase [Myroides marinus]MDM1350507.1 GNAT family N-acetyltransferase [Myroides marinus]MDM1355028.1 GNAT family N-acetyltransferase [Myroides marinus]MDM1357758.1 GNAT family N-acetyltransferase [Myroides marinus]
MNIRPATPLDMTDVLALIQELATFEKEPDAVEVTVEDLVREGFGANPLFNVIVAELDNRIIGMALFYNRFSTWKGKTIHLEDLIVTESMRGTGAGYKLYAEVMNIAKREGVRRVEWVVLNWNEPAINFYKKSGATVLEDWYTVQMDHNGIEQFSQSK